MISFNFPSLMRFLWLVSAAFLMSCTMLWLDSTLTPIDLFVCVCGVVWVWCVCVWCGYGVCVWCVCGVCVCGVCVCPPTKRYSSIGHS